MYEGYSENLCNRIVLQNNKNACMQKNRVAK